MMGLGNRLRWRGRRLFSEYSWGSHLCFRLLSCDPLDDDESHGAFQVMVV